VRNPPRTDTSTPRGARLERLQPIDSAPFREPSHRGFICLSIGLVWLLSLLPWRLWAYAPDLLLLVVVFWTLHEPRRVGLFTAFFLGLLMDVHDSTPMGVQALGYITAVYGTLALARRLRQFNALVQAVHMLLVLLLAKAVSHLSLAWLSTTWVGWTWAGAALLTAALWPLADLLLHMPQKRLDAATPGAV